ncbi:hypothetical protein [Hymenobacter koreensis]|uniref:Uncharacterized protein n=1 Tax=Hymenobacter koreensis TaxID=1084523 RepID=A0ABP8JN71_9BACT
MAYTMEQKAVFEYRLKQAKKGLKKKGIKYYVPAAMALDETVDAQQLRNVMNGGVMNEKALNLIERLAGTAQLQAA